MNPNLRLGLLLLALALAAPAEAAPAAPAGRAAAAHRGISPRTRTAVRADTTGHARPRVAPRTLDDIHIEGEIPVPQVLFITAREQRRFMEFQHHRYQRTSLELARSTATPQRIVVTGPAPTERKEKQP